MKPEDQLIYSLGKIVMHGMKEIDQVRKFTGEGLVHHYTTHFPMPDGRFWNLQLEIKNEETNHSNSMEP